jgi:hypothetical protein
LTHFQKITSTLAPNDRNRTTYETLRLEKCETMDTVHNMSYIKGLAIMNEGKLNLYTTNTPNPFKLASYEHTIAGHLNALYTHVQA